MITWLRNPWGRPRVLALVAGIYIAWSILPVAIAILFAFNNGRSRTAWQGFSLRWYWGDSTLSVWHRLNMWSSKASPSPRILSLQ